MVRAGIKFAIAFMLVANGATSTLAQPVSDWLVLQGKWASTQAACVEPSDGIITIDRSGISEHEMSCRISDRRRIANGWHVTQTCEDDEGSRTQRSLVVTMIDRLRISVTTIQQGQQPIQQTLLRCSSAAASPVQTPNIRSGVAYSDARQRLIQEGWQPVGEADALGCSSTGRSGDQRCYPELVDCAGTGEGQCLYVWRNGVSVLRVVTVDDPPVISSLAPASAAQAATANTERTARTVGAHHAAATTPQQSDSIPQFSHFRVADQYRGRNAPLVMTAEQRNYRTRLGEASRQSPNFAGRFVLTYWGCGTGCVTGAVYDAASGRVVEIPFTVSGATPAHANFNAIEFRANSRLVVFAGMRDEKAGDMGAHFYEFTGRGFRHIRTIPDDGTFSGRDR